MASPSLNRVNPVFECEYSKLLIYADTLTRPNEALNHLLLQSRVKGSGQRRPQSRAARQQSVQRSVSDQEDSAVEPNPRLNPTSSALGFPTTGPKPNLRAPRPMLPKPSGTSAFPTPSPSQLSFTESLTRPSVLSLPVSTHPGETDSSEVSGDAQPMLSSSDEDLFGSVAVSKSSAPPAPSITKKAPDPSPAGGPAPVSIFDQQATSDLFQKVKPRAKKAQAPSFMEDADEDGDDDEDIFGMSTGSTPSSTSDSRTPSSPAKLDRFQVQRLFAIRNENSYIDYNLEEVVCRLWKER